MKTLKLIVLLITLSVWYVQAQNSRYSIFVDLGFKYTPLEYLGGPLLGISLDNPEKKIGVNFRSDYIFSIAQKESTASEYIINNYNTYTYLDFTYTFTEKISSSIGAGWIYGGIGENIKLNKEYGYASGTISFKYTFDWLTAEIRGDIPLEDWNPILDRGHLFPVSTAFYYHFKPKK